MNLTSCKLADVAKLADALDLGSSGAIHVGSIPIIRTVNRENRWSRSKAGSPVFLCPDIPFY